MRTIEELLENTTLSDDGCNIWNGCLNSDGYARVNWKGDSNGKAHRVVYQLSNPDKDIKGLFIRHTCDNPKCINPEHLLSGSHQENMDDRNFRERMGKVAKLTVRDVKAIRQLYSSGDFKQKELAEMFNINHRTISSIVNNTHWKWVTVD